MAAALIKHFKASLRGTLGLVLCVSLSGCFASERELVGYWVAARPMAEGVYAHTPTHPDGTEWDRPTWTGEMSLNRRRYVSDVDNFPHQGARFYSLHADTYIAQIPREDGVGYGIAFVYEDGQVVSYHQPACSDVSDEVLAEAGVSRDIEGYCPIADLDQLEAMMRAYLVAMDSPLRVDGVYRRVD